MARCSLRRIPPRPSRTNATRALSPSFSTRSPDVCRYLAPRRPALVVEHVDRAVISRPGSTRILSGATPGSIDRRRTDAVARFGGPPYPRPHDGTLAGHPQHRAGCHHLHLGERRGHALQSLRGAHVRLRRGGGAGSERPAADAAALPRRARRIHQQVPRHGRPPGDRSRPPGAGATEERRGLPHRALGVGSRGGGRDLLQRHHPRRERARPGAGRAGPVEHAATSARAPRRHRGDDRAHRPRLRESPRGPLHDRAADAPSHRPVAHVPGGGVASRPRSASSRPRDTSTRCSATSRTSLANTGSVWSRSRSPRSSRRSCSYGNRRPRTAT